MIQVTPQMKVFLCPQAVDFRMQFDGLSATCRNLLKKDPMSGIVIVFINKKRTALKILTYDGQGLWLMAKRLSSGTFKWWPKTEHDCLELDAKNLLILIWNGDIESIKLGSDWKKLLA